MLKKIKYSISAEEWSLADFSNGTIPDFWLQHWKDPGSFILICHLSRGQGMENMSSEASLKDRFAKMQPDSKPLRDLKVNSNTLNWS